MLPAVTTLVSEVVTSSVSIIRARSPLPSRQALMTMTPALPGVEDIPGTMTLRRHRSITSDLSARQVVLVSADRPERGRAHLRSGDSASTAGSVRRTVDRSSSAHESLVGLVVAEVDLNESRGGTRCGSSKLEGSKRVAAQCTPAGLMEPRGDIGHRCTGLCDLERHTDGAGGISAAQELRERHSVLVSQIYRVVAQYLQGLNELGLVREPRGHLGEGCREPHRDRGGRAAGGPRGVGG
jgi:hypothetical protein